jgi:hypothetical protein
MIVSVFRLIPILLNFNLAQALLHKVVLDPSSCPDLFLALY